MPDETSDDIDPYGMTCAELVELVTEYLEGTLPEDQRARIDAHLGVCPPCVYVLDQWREVVALAGRLAEQEADRLAPEVRAELMSAFRDAVS